MKLKMKIEAVSSWADTKRASFRENHWTHQHFFPSLVSWVSFVVRITGQLGCQTSACDFMFHHGFSGLLEAFPASRPCVCVCVCGFYNGTITVNVGFVKPFSSASHSRLHVGPSCHLLPALFWLKCGRGPERWLRLPLRHSIHHLCATQPVSSSLRHGLPSTLCLLWLYENHISERLGEELHLIQNRTKASSFYLNVHEISILHL